MGESVASKPSRSLEIKQASSGEEASERRCLVARTSFEEPTPVNDPDDFAVFTGANTLTQRVRWPIIFKNTPQTEGGEPPSIPKRSADRTLVETIANRRDHNGRLLHRRHS